MVNLVGDDFAADGIDSARLALRGTSSQPRLFDVLQRRRRLIFLAALTGAGIFSTYAYLATPSYTAEALIITNQPEFGHEASPLTASRETQAAALSSEIDMIKSPAFVARVVEQFNLTTDPEFNGSLGWFMSGAKTGLGTDQTRISFLFEGEYEAPGWLRWHRGTSFCVSLNMILLPHYGLTGAVITQVATELLLLALYIRGVRQLNMEIRLWHSFRPATFLQAFKTLSAASAE